LVAGNVARTCIFIVLKDFGLSFCAFAAIRQHQSSLHHWTSIRAYIVDKGEIMSDGDWISMFANLSWFKRSRRTPVESAQALGEALVDLQALQQSATVDSRQLLFYGMKPRKRAAKHLRALKVFLVDDSATSSNPSNAGNSASNASGGKDQMARQSQILELMHVAVQGRLILSLVRSLGLIDFESRKDAVSVVSCLLRRRQGIRLPMIELLLADPEQLRDLSRSLLSLHPNPHSIDGVSSGNAMGGVKSEVALFAGMLLRECVSFELLLEAVLDSAGDLVLSVLFEQAKLPTFDVASDAQASLKVSTFPITNLYGEYARISCSSSRECPADSSWSITGPSLLI
jgi:hypothetical protein